MELKNSVLLYDGDCQMCVKAANWSRKLLSEGELDIIRNDNKVILKELEVDAGKVEHLLVFHSYSSRTTYFGYEAIREIFRESGTHGWIVKSLSFQPLHKIYLFAYSLLSKNRKSLSKMMKMVSG